MTRDELLQKMRIDFLAHDLTSLKRHFYMGHWLLTDDDKERIEVAMKKLEQEDLPEMVKYALEVLGGRIVEK